jgi:hypothetical protein
MFTATVSAALFHEAVVPGGDHRRRDAWSGAGEGRRTHAADGWFAIFGVMLLDAGAPVIAVGAVGD